MPIAVHGSACAPPLFQAQPLCGAAALDAPCVSASLFHTPGSFSQSARCSSALHCVFPLFALTVAWCHPVPLTAVAVVYPCSMQQPGQGRQRFDQSLCWEQSEAQFWPVVTLKGLSLHCQFSSGVVFTRICKQLLLVLMLGVLMAPAVWLQTESHHMHLWPCACIFVAGRMVCLCPECACKQQHVESLGQDMRTSCLPSNC